MNNRGQAGPLGEDLISLIVIILAFAAYVILLNGVYMNQLLQRTQADKSLKTTQAAAYLAAQWSYVGPQNTVYSRLIDPTKACVGCPTGVFVELRDMEKNLTLCSCGNRTEDAVAKIPVAIRYNLTDVRAGNLEARLTG